MIKNETLLLGGKERELIFGGAGFYDHIHKLTGKMPTTWISELPMREGKTELDGINSGAIIICACLNTYEDANDLENTPFEKVKKWTNGLDPNTIGEICTKAFEVFVNDQPKNGELKQGEQQAQTQDQN